VIVSAGAPAIATTSAGISWSLGSPDGESLAVEAMVAAIGRIAQAVDVPVSADIEAGYGASPAAVAATLEAVVASGAVGINLEDTPGGTLLSGDEQATRISHARETAARLGLDVWINARTDVFLTGTVDAPEAVGDAFARGAAYAEAGADSLFVPGVVDPDVIGELARGHLPLNVMAGPGSPPVSELARLGVRRVSVGAAIAQAAYGLVSRSGRELVEQGTYVHLEGGLGYAVVNSMLGQTSEPVSQETESA